MLATLQGVEAVEAVLESTPDTPSPMIAINENKITRKPLMDAVKLVCINFIHIGILSIANDMAQYRLKPWQPAFRIKTLKGP